MDWATLLVFIPACFAINLAFGPNNLLSVTVGVRHGARPAVMSGLARLIAFIPMIAISAAGLGVLLATSATAFAIVKYLGAAYLIWLGIRILRSASSVGFQSPGNGTPVSVRLMELARREFLVAAGNPKAVVVFTAFFPQFITSPENYWQSFAVLGAIFLVLELIAIVVYSLLGSMLGRTAKASVVTWFSRASGVGMIVFGGLLALARRPA